MKNIQNITNDLLYIGSSDRKLSFFEAVYPVVDGVSYNSYLLLDEKTVLFDTVDKHCAEQFFENLKAGLEGKNLDYFIINHLEPDHSALIKKVIEKYPSVKLVCNAKTKQMLFQFFEFDFDIEQNFEIVKEGDSIKTGQHELSFVMAPMVHWPEVMVTYDKTDKILFSADAFGSFGALNGNIFDNETELDLNEYRRYYTNIVGKYGAQVNALLNKAANLEIKMVCPLHGVILKENISKLISLYSKWANYEPEIKSVLISYASVYGGTQNAAEILATKLAQKGIKNIKMHDVSMVHHSFILAQAFKYSHIVLASPTYNNCIFVKMEQFINEIISHNLQNRTFAIVENGSWAPNCANTIKTSLENLKGSKFIEEKMTIKSTLKANQEEELENLANAIVEDIKKGA
ncbi:MAG: FprA family A-type flavoprotein [Candidatus Gastranaerophilales bacterium]|nr:FprA family A-type flavoprotein [Candidatus Gastranaerophilales bacterium]